jgi:acyl carrier protein
MKTRWPKYTIASGFIAVPLVVIGQNSIWMITMAFVVVAGACLFDIRSFRRRVRFEIHKFEQGPNTPALDFLSDIGIAQSSNEAQVVLTARDIIAEFAGIPPDCIRADLKFPKDFGILFDSLDVIEFILQFESRLGIRISDGKTDIFWPDPRETVKWTVKEYVLGVLQFCQEQHRQSIIPTDHNQSL